MSDDAFLAEAAAGILKELTTIAGLREELARETERPEPNRRAIGSILQEISAVARVLAGLPRRAESFISRAEQGRLEVRMPELKHHVARLERGVRKLAGSIIFAAGLLAGTQLFLGGHFETAIAVGVVEIGLLGWILLGR